MVPNHPTMTLCSHIMIHALPTNRLPFFLSTFLLSYPSTKPFFISCIILYNSAYKKNVKKKKRDDNIKTQTLKQLDVNKSTVICLWKFEENLIKRIDNVCLFTIIYVKGIMFFFSLCTKCLSTQFENTCFFCYFFVCIKYIYGFFLIGFIYDIT